MLDLIVLTFRDPHTASRRFRVEAYRPWFQKQGMTFRIAGLEDAFVQRMARLLALPRANTVLIHKKLLRRVELGVVRRKARRVLYDFDDAVYLGKKASARFAALVPAVDHVFAGNDLLAQRARRHNPNVTVVPTGLDLDRFCPRPRPENPVPVVGWIGTKYNLKDLRLAAGPVARLREKRDVRALYVCDAQDRALNASGWEHVPWSSKAETASLARFDVGVMPLHDTEYNRGKCGFKILQYMAMGVPAVASPVGFNRGLINHGVNGLLAGAPRDWTGALETLLADRTLYAAVRDHALSRVQDFSLEKTFARMRPVLFP